MTTTACNTARIIGGGLAGAEAALVLSYAGISIQLIEMRPLTQGRAHKTDLFAELVCSNNFGTDEKFIRELAEAGSPLMGLLAAMGRPSADGFLVNGKVFAEEATRLIRQSKNITVIKKEETDIDTAVPQIIAVGPLPPPAFMGSLQQMLGKDNVYLFDVAEPVIDIRACDEDFLHDETGRLYCPLSAEELAALSRALAAGKPVQAKPFRETTEFLRSRPAAESLRTDELAARLKSIAQPPLPANALCALTLEPAGAAGLFSLAGLWGRLDEESTAAALSTVPALAKAKLVFCGVVHRSSYIASPALLTECLQAKEFPNIFFAGQIAGTDGYAAAVASGYIAAQGLRSHILGLPLIPPAANTAAGRLVRGITTQAPVRACVVAG